MSEILPIVDDNDNVIGFKERNEILPTDINRASGLWVTNSSGEILLARRAANKANNPNCWGPAVAGTVAKDETYESCMIREAAEELGIKDLYFSPVAKSKAIGFNSHFVQWFSCILDWTTENFTLQKEEVAEIKWFSKEEILTYFKSDPDDFIDTFHQWIDLFLNDK